MNKVEELMLLKHTVGKLEQTVQHFSDVYDQVLATMKTHSLEIAALKKKVEEAEANNGKEEISKLRQQINQLEQYSRHQNLEIHGLPHSDNEVLLDKVNDLAKTLQLAELSRADVERMHRLPPKPGKVPVVLVRFVSRVTRDEWMTKK